MKNKDTVLQFTDEEIVEKIVIEKNTILYATLYKRYESKVYNKCLAFVKNTNEAKELTQEVFLELFIKLHKYSGQSNFSTWLNAFTYKFCVNYLNKKRESKNGERSNNCNGNQPHLLIDVSDNSLFLMREEKLQKAMQYLSPEDKSILLLKYQDELTMNEVMALLNIDEHTFNIRLRRAKAGIIEIYNRL